MISRDFPEAGQDFIRDLERAGLETYFDRLSRLIYSTDASIYQMMPVGVAIPREASDVVAAMEIAKAHHVPVLPRGGGSSLAGQAVGHALILDLSRYMNRIQEIDAEGKRVVTQPGITLGKLNRSLRAHGMMFAPDPASADRATIGGIAANNSAGAHSIVYGMTADHVLETEVVLSDGSQARFDAFEAWEARAGRGGLEGTIYREVSRIVAENVSHISNRYPKTFRHVAGYNLDRMAGASQPNLSSLIVGSEGTLGIMTSLTLNIVPVLNRTRLALVHFDDMRQAMESVPLLLESEPTAIEVMDKMLLDLTRDKVEYRRLITFIEGNPVTVLLVEYAADSETELDGCIQRLKGKLEQINHRQPVVVISDPVEQANVWYVRKVGLGILMSIRGDSKPIPFIEDAAVPVESLADYVSEIYAYSYEVGVESVAMYAHASAGCLHIRPLVNLKSAAGLHQLRAIAEKSLELVLRYQGTTSGEHGEGLVRGEFSEALFGKELYHAFRQVKHAFDPEGLLNPGKVVDAPRMDDETILRFGTGYAVPYAYPQTVFGFREDHGFAAAVEMCSGAGVCRKTGEGVMCPSFQVTRNEADSTRGRANALRSAMMGLLGPDGMTSKELYSVLDLCLSCQACRSECPSSVDMAKLKSEFLYHYYGERGMPLRARAFSEISRVYDLLQPYSGIVNRLSGLAPLLSIGGVHPDRKLPGLARQRFSKWFATDRHSASASPGGGTGEVVLFHDTFMEYNEPGVGVAAVQVLETAGYSVTVLTDRACCGRPAVSKGNLDLARKNAEWNIALLAPFAERGVPILGCEPSCTTLIHADYPDLVDGEPARKVAEHTITIEAFLDREIRAGRAKFTFDHIPREVLFHGHCQQKSIFGTGATMNLLRSIPACTVREIESGCCGMAGSFGYEKEHYGLSVQLAEITLAPAIRAASPGTIISAAGTSCRDQIRHTTGREVIHPIQVFAGSLST